MSIRAHSRLICEPDFCFLARCFYPNGGKFVLQPLAKHFKRLLLSAPRWSVRRQPQPTEQATGRDLAPTEAKSTLNSFSYHLAYPQNKWKFTLLWCFLRDRVEKPLYRFRTPRWLTSTSLLGIQPAPATGPVEHRPTRNRYGEHFQNACHIFWRFSIRNCRNTPLTKKSYRLLVFQSACVCSFHAFIPQKLRSYLSNYDTS